jgi:hypothetical protein
MDAPVNDIFRPQFAVLWLVRAGESASVSNRWKYVQEIDERFSALNNKKATGKRSPVAFHSNRHADKRIKQGLLVDR